MPLRLPAALAALATLALAAPGAGAKQTYTATPSPERAAASSKIVTPRGLYRGSTGGSRKIELQVARRSVELVAFDFKCRRTVGRTSLNGLALKKTRRGWRLPQTRIFGSATYADDHPDENVRVDIGGRFSSTGRRIVGTLRVRSPHCGSTSEIDWSARRR